MRASHKETFFQVAEQCVCWIGLREPNPLSDRWCGRQGYRPKGEECKAKTSDNPDFHYAGLVVDPHVCPEAFQEATRASALETWDKKFLKNGALPPGFGRNASGAEKGLVRQQGMAIFADYDLMALTRSNAQGLHLFTSNQEARALFQKVAPLLNAGFGTPMIQHGAEFTWDGGVGARETEFVLWFGPGRRFKQTMSSMPKGGH